MATKLYAIGGTYTSEARLRNTEHDGDTTKLPASVVIHTGGEDGDFVTIPDCSAAKYFDAHHLSIYAVDGSWSVSVWNDDSQGHALFWSKTDWGMRNRIDGFSNNDGVEGVALFVLLDASNNVLSVNPSKW